MNSAKQLVILTPGFPESEGDENCIPLVQVYLKALHRIEPDLQISVIAFQYPFTNVPYTWYGIPVYPMGGKNKKGLLRLWTWFKVWRKLIALKVKSEKLLLHSFWLNECYWMGSLFSRRYGSRHLTTVLGQDAKKDNLYLRIWKDSRCSIICCSEFAAAVLERDHGIQCQSVIPLGVDPLEFQNVTPGNRKLDIVGVGNLGPVKRYDVFVNVVAEIKKQLPDISAEIIGDGEYKEELQSLIKKLGITNNLKLIGGIPRSKVLQRLRQTKLLLHTSAYEGQGYVYLEALASGTSVVALNRGFLPPSDIVAIVERDEDLAMACITMLNKMTESRSFIPVPIEQTVMEYLKLYNF